jgi:hypothetical protein
MSDEFFGENKDHERDPNVKVIWPLRAANVIEGLLNGAMGEEMALEAHRAPAIFIDADDGTYNAADYTAIYGELSLSEAIAMQGIVYGDIGERYRRQLIVARESDGTMADYLLRCEVEGIEPLLKRNAT